MRLSALRLSMVFSLALLGAASLGVAPVGAQTLSWSRFGVGYVTNAPSMMAGVNAYILFPSLGGWGLYADAKFDPSSPAHDKYFLKDTTAQYVQDHFQNVEYLQRLDSWQSFNVAVVRPVTPALMLYMGGGFAKRRRYNNYRDPSQTHGQLGLFWVQSPTETATTGNFMVGAFLRLGRHIAFQTGIETRPLGFSLGGTLKFPPR